MMFLLLLSYSGLHSGVTMMARILFSQTMNSSTEVTLQGGNVFFCGVLRDAFASWLVRAVQSSAVWSCVACINWKKRVGSMSGGVGVVGVEFWSLALFSNSCCISSLFWSKRSLFS